MNDVLVHALAEEHGLKLDIEDALAEFQGDDEDEPYAPESFFNELTKQAAKVPGFRVQPRCVVGNFAFQKMAIVNDLKRLAESLTAHDLIAAIAGDRDAGGALAARRVSVDPREFDARPPDDEFLILDADSSQHRVVEAVVRGDNGVVSGPPGTGKSQTIANLIAELVARGKSVLFVAEKRAALDVVLRRLSNAGLGHLCLDCHGAELTRKQVAEQLQQSLDVLRDAPVPETADAHKRLVQRRTTLNAHCTLMNAKVQPWQQSPIDVYGKLMRLPEAARTKARVTVEGLRTLTPLALDNVREAVEALQSLEDLVTGRSVSPWLGASLTTLEDSRQAVERSRSLAGGRWASAHQALQSVCTEAGIDVPVKLAGVPTLLALLRKSQACLEQYSTEIFDLDLPACIDALAPATSWWTRLWASISNADYRRALAQVRQCSKVGIYPPEEALAKAQDALALLSEWRALDGATAGTPKALQQLSAAEAGWSDIRNDLEGLLNVFPQRSFDAQPVAAVAERLSALATDGVTPARVVSVSEHRKRLAQVGFGDLWPVFTSGSHDADDWPDVLEACWLQSCLEELQLRHPQLATFSGKSHDKVAREFRALDAERLELAVQRVRRAHAVRALAARNNHPKQDQLVLNRRCTVATPIAD